MVVMEQEDARTKWASNDDWIRIRPLFTQLYREKKLKEVKRILEEQHDFYATYAGATVAITSISS